MSDHDPKRPGASTALVGRTAELEQIRAFTRGAAGGDGGALLLSGEAGAGTSALLGAAAEEGTRAGMRILHAAGAAFEADVEFAALNQALMPLQTWIARLAEWHRHMLQVALGFRHGAAPNRLVVSNATLELLRVAASDARPILLVVDDLQWVDRSSAIVLGFVARRLAGSRVGLIGATHTGIPTAFDPRGLPQLFVSPLRDDAALALLRTRFPALAPTVRGRVLAAAQGNPLALRQLPLALTPAQRAGAEGLPALLPLGDRLDAVYGAPVAALPEATRFLLLEAVLDGTGDLLILKAATGEPGLDDLAPAEAARLVHVDEQTHRMAFRHPLTPSAVLAHSTLDERRRAHRALAAVLGDQPERQARHLAEAVEAPDEEVAGILARAARRALRRGDATGAVASMRRAADLSPAPADRARRIATAAYLGAHVTGELREVPRLLAAAQRIDPDVAGTLPAAAASAYRLLGGEGDVDMAHRVLVDAIERADAAPGDPALADALHTLLLVSAVAARPELWARFAGLLDGAGARGELPDWVALPGRAFRDPVRDAPAVLPRLDAAIAGLHAETDPTRVVAIAFAGLYIDRVGACREPLRRVVEDGRAGGAVTSALFARLLLAFDDAASGRWEEGERLAAESLEICETLGYPMLAIPVRCVQSLLAAMRGDLDHARALSEASTRWAAPRRANLAVAIARRAQTLVALADGDHEAAFQHASALSPAGELPRYVPHALCGIFDLVEAAMHTGREAEAVAHVAAVRTAGVADLSPRLALLACGAAALVADDDAQARDLFERALEVPGVERWAFDLARVQLAYGERLRRTRAAAASRAHLTAALETFARLGAVPWAERARSELRATGRRHARAAGSGSGSAAAGREPVVLTPQEREIALLAAAGLTNREIGERLFLSHRTIGAHLYRVFPRLGVTSRAALRDALVELDGG